MAPTGVAPFFPSSAPSFLAAPAIAACMAAIHEAGSIAPAGPVADPGNMPGGMPGNITGGAPIAGPAPGPKAAIHLPIISINSGSAAVAAIWSRHRS